MNWVSSASSRLSNSAVVHASATPSVVGRGLPVLDGPFSGRALARPQMGQGASDGVDNHTSQLPAGTYARERHQPPRRKGDPEESPFWPLALLCVARHRPGSALTGGTASSQACALAQAGHWAGLVEGLVPMTVGVGPSGDHFVVVPSRARFSQAGQPIWASRSALRPPL